jgi:ferric-chelate reductase
MQTAPPLEGEENGSDSITTLKNRSNSLINKEAVTTTAAIRRTSTVNRSLKALPFATLVARRPDMREMVWDLAEQAEGEMAVFACGPLELSMGIGNTVASVSDERAVHKGTGAEGIYLHVESFCW